MIDVSKLKELVKLMVDNELSEIDLRDEQQKVTIRRGASGPVVYASPHASAAPVLHSASGALPAAHAPAPSAALAQPSAHAASDPDAGLIAIESPMVGTFYSAANPDSPPFVKPGAKIDAGTVVCLIEAMKVFNEIKAEKSGTVERVLVKNGQAVEFGQKLFLLKP